MNCVYVDLDGPLVDFERYKRETGLSFKEIKNRPDAYLDIEPTEGGLAAVRSLIGAGFEVKIASKPVTGVPYTYANKVAWVLKYLPELKRKIILTHDKGILGDEGDYLIDDRPHKANCVAFRGKLLVFTPGPGAWDGILSELLPLRPKPKR